MVNRVVKNEYQKCTYTQVIDVSSKLILVHSVNKVFTTLICSSTAIRMVTDDDPTNSLNMGRRPQSSFLPVVVYLESSLCFIRSDSIPTCVAR